MFSPLVGMLPQWCTMVAVLAVYTTRYITLLDGARLHGMNCVERPDRVEHGSRNGRRRPAMSTGNGASIVPNATLKGVCSPWALSVHVQGNGT